MQGNFPLLIHTAVLYTPISVTPRDHVQRPNGIQVIDVDVDGTTAMLHEPMESDQIMNSLTAHKSEVRPFFIAYC